MFARPGLCGMGIGRLGLVAASRPSLVAQALAILAKYGSAANLYLPGVGAISGITAGNWLDSAGTTAATVDNPVGLVVSAGKAVGPELVTNGDFSNGTTGWTRGNTGTQTIESGALRVAGDGTTAWSGMSETTIPALTKGKQYLVQFSVLAENTSSGAGLYFRTSSLSIGGIFTNGLGYFYPSAVGNYSILYTATVDNINQLRIVAGIESNASVLFDNISVREPPGAHLTQSTAANRPILRLAGGVYAWDFVSSDSFTTTMTPGNAGFFCASANVTDSGVLRTLLGAGAGSDASSGVWLARAASNALTLQVGNGTTRNSVSAAYPVATNAVASAGWDASTMFVGINNTETSGAKTVNCTSSNTMNVGVLTGTTNPMLGTISGGAIIMPTVLPTTTERATLRQFIASLSGVTM